MEFSTLTTSTTDEKLYLFVFTLSFLFYQFHLECIFNYSIFFYVVSNQTSNKKYLLELIKRRSEDHEKNMLCDCNSKFNQ